MPSSSPNGIARYLAGGVGSGLDDRRPPKVRALEPAPERIGSIGHPEDSPEYRGWLFGTPAVSFQVV